MAFDPKKPYYTIHGHSSDYPGAKFEQNGRIYDVHKNEVRAGEAPKVPAAPTPPPVDIEALEVALVKAKDRAKKKPTPAHRTAVTELEKQIQKASM